MRAFLLFLMISGLSLMLQAQQGNFKRPIKDADLISLKKIATECFAFNPSLKFSYNQLDLAKNSQTISDKPATTGQLEILKKKLEQQPSDADLCTEIAGMCSRMKMPDEAREYRKRAFDVISATLEVHPDSAAALVTLGGIYLSALQMDSALSKYRQALARDPLNEDANRLVPFVHILNNRFDSAYTCIIRQINRYPDSYEVHEALPVYYIYKFYDQLNKYSQLKSVDEDKLRPENIIMLKLLKDYEERDKSDFRRQFLYKVTYQVCLSTLITYKTVNDSLFNTKAIRFRTNARETELLRQQQEFFRACLSKKAPVAKYLPNKALGNICLLMNQPKEALPFLRKAIHLKPVEKSTVTNNASEDYDNLITAFFILKDTIRYQETMLEKIKRAPAIDPQLSDYITAGKISLSRKKYEDAEIRFREGLSLDPQQPDCLLGLALIQFIQNDYSDALANINAAYDAGKNKWELYILYGIVSLCDKDPVNAFESFKTARRLHNSPWIRQELMEKYFDLY